jgi:hypothetical protein
MISFTTVSKRFEKASTPDRYNYYSNSSSENVAYNNFALGVEFEGKGFDKLDHKARLLSKKK